MASDFERAYGRAPRMGYEPSTSASPAFPSVRLFGRENRLPVAPTSDLRDYVKMAGLFGPTKGWSPIFDQADSGSCVAQACSMGWRTRLFFLAANGGGSLADIELEAERIDAPSRLEGYLGARRVTGGAAFDEGTQIQGWFDYVNRLGIAPEHHVFEGGFSLVFSDRRIFEPVCDNAQVRMAAHDNKILDGVHRLDDGLGRLELRDAIDESLSNGEPVVWGAPLDVDYARLAPSAVYRREKPMIGRHAQLLVGHTPTAWITVNSWGDYWCDNGFGLVEKAWVLDEGRDLHRFGLLPKWLRKAA